MKVLLAASEVAPIIKVGGLGDVVGSLPVYLTKIGINVDVAVPYFPYCNLSEASVVLALTLYVNYGGSTEEVFVYKTKLPNSSVDVFLFKNSTYFNIKKPNFFENSARESEAFTFFSCCIVEFVVATSNTYDVVHCHDWHTGMVPHLLEDGLGNDRPATVFTIHNLAYQGSFDAQVLEETGLSLLDHPLVKWDLEDGYVNCMKQGILSSDRVNTVSEGYAEEIKTVEVGYDLAELIVERGSKFSGILNGIDYTLFPLSKKPQSRPLVRPSMSYIGRLDPNQKGIELIYNALPWFKEHDVQLNILGTGDPIWQQKLVDASLDARYSGIFKMYPVFDLKLATDLYVTSDFILIPSKYEPCGLVQMIAMHYGALPLVHAVGGLKDTVKHKFNGVSFIEYSDKAFEGALNNALTIYNDFSTFTLLKHNARESHFGWEESSVKYFELYKKAILDRKESKF